VGVFIFTEETRSVFQEAGLEDKLIEFENLLGKHNQRYIYKLTPLPNRPERLLGQNGLHYIQLSLYRSTILIEGCSVAINHQNGLMTALGARAHFEITCAIAFFLKKLNSFYNGFITYENIDETLGRLTLGISSKGNIPEAPDPISVMNMIDAADDLVKKRANVKKSIFRDSYDELSEFCHPNSFGIYMGTTVNKVGVIRYDNQLELHKKMFHFVNRLLITASAFLMFYDQAYEMLSSNEDLPIISRTK
jgi:hypothetical protein